MLNKFCYGTLCWRASSGFSCNESKYGIDAKAISGIILNDAAGLNMKITWKNPPTAQYDYLATWTNNPENWKAASPIYFIDKIRLLLIYVGEQTYGSIKLQTINF
jgi:hypothetical protein